MKGKKTITHKSKKELPHIVRLYDGFDNVWIDVSEPLPYEEAMEVWNEKTDNGTKNTKFDDIDYYAVFPADTRMIFTY